MKKHVLILFFGIIYLQTIAQEKETFKPLLSLEATSLNNQQSSGTCWSFAVSSFLEAEAIRLGKKAVTISPIFYVHPTYLKKAEKFVETKGKTWLDAGDLSFSVLDAYKKHGAVPEEVYNGIIKGDWQHDHVEMDNLIEAMLKSVATSGYGRIKPVSWKKSLDGVLNAYLGKAPQKFIYKNKEYTPKSFADEHIGINVDDYVEITSYTHHPFYEEFVLNIPANWSNGKYVNLPISDFEKVINNALKNGYSLAWDGDASEPNFNFDKGIAKLTSKEEKFIITQGLRQKTFEDKSTTDDHNMHIIGISKNKKGELYYKMKNSEGDNDQGGYVYMSKKALLLKTISVLVHKDAIPVDIKKKIFSLK